MPTAVKFPAKLMLRLPEGELKRLRNLARQDDRPASALARRLLLDAMTRLEAEAGTVTHD